MKNFNLPLYCFLALFCSFVTVAQAHKYLEFQKTETDKSLKTNNYYDDEEEKYKADFAWKQNGFDFFIGGGIYFAGKKTANYYNGAPENDIYLKLLSNNEFYWRDVFVILKQAYPGMDTMVLRNDYNTDSRYSIAMDISLGARYRFARNWYFELSYSFKRISCENRFIFDNPYGIPDNKDNPPYSNWEHTIAKEDRHYIDFSVGYMFQKNQVAKPFLSIGAQFNYVNIKSFLAIIEGEKFDLMALAKYPNWIPGHQNMPNYRVWAGPGYGFSFTAGLKIVVNKSVSLDPVFQLSVGSFGHSPNLPGFNTNLCFNYMAGVRIVMGDRVFAKK